MFTTAANRAQEAAAARVRELAEAVLGEQGTGPRRPANNC